MSGPTCQDVRTVWVKAFSHNWGYQPGVPPPEQQQINLHRGCSMSITKIALASARFGTDEPALKAAVGDCVYGSGCQQWLPLQLGGAACHFAAASLLLTQYTHSGC
mmetsp:Transcript_10881/g.29855  ORF Transcript_10881/g.29855 Transcript_10881/m.29855 type:complete len:106 (+) Transcript_10881:699-1016(+)